nr:PepSY domain-containing protein [Elstera litoralis]
MTTPSEERRFYATAWRWHFYAGLYVAPFLIMLAVTGLLMLWSSVLVGRDGEKRYAVAPQSTNVAVSAQAATAEAAVSGGQAVQYIAPRTADQPAVFRVNGAGGPQMVAVDPYTGAMLGHWDRRSGVYDLANKIHGTLFLGDVGDVLIEVAAGFGIVLIVTGVYMAWPRGGQSFRAVLVPDLAARGARFLEIFAHLHWGLCGADPHDILAHRPHVGGRLG